MNTKYHNHQNIESLLSKDKEMKLPHKISAGLTKDEFRNEIRKLSAIDTAAKISLEQQVHNAFNSKVIGLSAWFQIYADQIKGVPVNKPTHRIYLAVDNSYIHAFAFLLVKKCEK